MDLAAYADEIDPNAWNGPAFAADFSERIVEPGLHASELLMTWSYVTRMYTTISPQEMTVDPIFHLHPDLPEVDNRQQFANQATFCTGDSAVTLPDGREVFVPAGQGWPSFQDEMPWVEDVQEMPEGGMPPIPVIDNTQRIDELLGQWNAMHDWPPGPGGGNDGGGSGTDGIGSTDGVDGDADGDGTGPGADGGMKGSEEPFGCGCTSGSGPTGGLVMLLAIALARVRRRRAA
jgi:MYXO-CTERM domain-containing protein